MEERYRPTLAVHVVWHPGCAEGPGYGRAVFSAMFEDPGELTPLGPRIPVRLWTSSAGEPDPPPPDVPPLGAAQRNAAAVLLDGEFLRGQGWLALLDRIEEARGQHDVLLVVALSPRALDVASPALEGNAIRLYDVDADLRQQTFLNRLTHALCRLVADTQDPVRLFLSHAKRDGVEITERVREFLRSGAGVADFFDAQDILEGARWAEVIRGAAAQNVLVAVRTDAYATREWCRTEVLEAKLAGSPVVVIDALETLEPRGFPYLGNAPSVRWREDASRESMEYLLGVVLRETLRFRHFPLRVADLCRAYALPEHDRVLPAPPELLTLLRVRADGDARPLVYPDPPMGSDEMALFAELAPKLGLVTPTRLLAGS